MRLLRSFLLVMALVACGGFPLAVATWMAGDAEAAEELSPTLVPDTTADTLRSREDLVEVKVRQVAAAPDGSLHVVFLAPAGGKQVMPLFVSEEEAGAIADRLDPEAGEVPDPALVERLLSRLGGEVKGAIITEMDEAEMKGYLLVAIPNQADLQVPAPAAEVVALALARKAPILVAKEILDVVGFSKEDLAKLGNKGESPDRPDWVKPGGTSL